MGDLAHVPELGRAGTGREKAAVHARQPDGIESRRAERRHDSPVHRPRHDLLDHFGHLGARHAAPVAFLDGQTEPLGEGADGVPATVDHDHGVEPRERAGAPGEPAGPVELVAAQLDDARRQHGSPAVSSNPSITFMF